MDSDRRDSQRKFISGVELMDLTSLSSYHILASSGLIVDASTTGFLVRVGRSALNDDMKDNLNVDSIVGHRVALFLPQMNLDLDGQIIRGQHIGRGEFEIAIEFSNEVPEYWRECLIDLLPDREELEAFEKSYS